MAGTSVIGKSVIVVSAVVGGVVGVFELSDRFYGNSETPEPTTSETALDTANSNSSDFLNDSTEPKASEFNASASSLPTDKSLEPVISERIGERLLVYGCESVEIDAVDVVRNKISEAETSHGFEGHTLEGTVVLSFEGVPTRFRLVGSGKGSTGAQAANDMAVQGFDEVFEDSELFKTRCKGD